MIQISNMAPNTAVPLLTRTMTYRHDLGDIFQTIKPTTVSASKLLSKSSGKQSILAEKGTNCRLSSCESREDIMLVIGRVVERMAAS